MKHIIKYICYITIFIIPPYISTAQISTKDFEDALLRANAKAAAKEIEKLAKEMFNEAKSVYEREIINSLNNVSRRDKTKNPYAYRIKIDNLSKICYFASDAEARRFVNEIESSRKAALNIFKEAKWNTKAYADAYNEVVRPIEQQLISMMGSPVTMQKVKNSYYKGNAASKETEQNSNRYITNREQKLGIYANKLNKTGTLTIKQKEVSTKAINQLDNLNANFGEREKSAAYYDQSGILHLDPNAKIATQQDDWDQTWRKSYANELKKGQEDAISLIKLHPLQNTFNVDLNSYSKEELTELAKEFKQHQLLSCMSQNVYHELDDVKTTQDLVNAGYKIMSSEINPGLIHDIIHKYLNNEIDFKANVYYNTKEGKWVIAYAGQDLAQEGYISCIPGAIDYNDPQNTISQKFTNDVILGIIRTEYPDYESVSPEEKEAIYKEVTSRITLTGHGIGGRFATMNGILMGINTVVYNPAYIPSAMNEMIETNSQLKWNAENLITTINTTDDSFTKFQNDPSYFIKENLRYRYEVLQKAKNFTTNITKDLAPIIGEKLTDEIGDKLTIELLKSIPSAAVAKTIPIVNTGQIALDIYKIIGTYNNDIKNIIQKNQPLYEDLLIAYNEYNVTKQRSTEELFGNQHNSSSSIVNPIDFNIANPIVDFNITNPIDSYRLKKFSKTKRISYGKTGKIIPNIGNPIKDINNAYNNGYNIITEYIKNHVSN